MKDLHLKFKMNEGTVTYETVMTDDGNIEVPSESYLIWVEELALKQLHTEKLTVDLCQKVASMNFLKNNTKDADAMITNAMDIMKQLNIKQV